MKFSDFRRSYRKQETGTAEFSVHCLREQACPPRPMQNALPRGASFQRCTRMAASAQRVTWVVFFGPPTALGATQELAFDDQAPEPVAR
jgi:hypothetical protein